MQKRKPKQKERERQGAGRGRVCRYERETTEETALSKPRAAESGEQHSRQRSHGCSGPGEAPVPRGPAFPAPKTHGGAGLSLLAPVLLSLQRTKGRCDLLRGCRGGEATAGDA